MWSNKSLLKFKRGWVKIKNNIIINDYDKIGLLYYSWTCENGWYEASVGIDKETGEVCGYFLNSQQYKAIPKQERWVFTLGGEF